VRANSGPGRTLADANLGTNHVGTQRRTSCAPVFAPLIANVKLLTLSTTRNSKFGAF